MIRPSLHTQAIPVAGLLVCLVACAGTAAWQAPARDDAGGVAAHADSTAYERGRRYTRWLLDGTLDSLARRFSPTLLRAVGGREGLGRLRERLGAQAGAEVAVVSEAVYPGPTGTDYYRVSQFAKLPDTTMTTRWVWTAGDTIVGATVAVTPASAPTAYGGYRTRTPLRLPFVTPPGARWYVAWGGRSVQQNYHAVAPDQRFAYDFVLVRAGTVHTGRGDTNADFHCFGVPILAPAAGVVVTAVDTVADNVPGQVNEGAPPGNYVVIDHGAGERSLIAHFRHGTVRVHPGAHVAAGDTLGACGNSGRSTLPHVHYHLQTGRAFGAGVGLPAAFVDYVADGRRVARGEPVRGQYLTSAP